jgi:hypothetical protein
MSTCHKPCEAFYVNQCFIHVLHYNTNLVGVFPRMTIMMCLRLMGFWNTIFWKLDLISSLDIKMVRHQFGWVSDQVIQINSFCHIEYVCASPPFPVSIETGQVSKTDSCFWSPGDCSVHLNLWFYTDSCLFIVLNFIVYAIFHCRGIVKKKNNEFLFISSWL